MATDAGAIAKLDEIEDRPLSVPTLADTAVGVGVDPETAEGQQFEAVMEQVHLAPDDAEAARRAIDVQRQLIARGEQIGAGDAMIAGIALARDEPVVTRNADAFSRTPARVAPY